MSTSPSPLRSALLCFAMVWSSASREVRCEEVRSDASTKVAQADSEARPELAIAAPSYDWGTAFRGETIRHTFSIANSGKATLVIEEVKPQCGCTLASGHKTTLAPGESTQLTLTLETGAMTGAKQKFTEIVSNALTEENKLLMEGEIVDLFTLDPKMPRVEAILATTRQRPPAELRLEQNIDREVKIREVKSKNGRLEAVFAESSQGGKKSYLVSMQPRVSKKDTTAFQSDSLQLYVDVDGKPVELSFPVTIALRNRIGVNPSKSVHFSRKETAALLEGTATDAPADAAASPEVVKTLDIQSLGDPDHRFKITHVEAEKKHFKAVLETVVEGKHYRLKISVGGLPDGKARFVRDKIQVKTDDPEVPLLLIPAMAQFARKR